MKDSYYGKENAPEIMQVSADIVEDTSGQILSVYENLSMKMPKNDFTIGIVDDVTFKSLPVKEDRHGRYHLRGQVLRAWL